MALLFVLLPVTTWGQTPAVGPRLIPAFAPEDKAQPEEKRPTPPTPPSTRSTRRSRRDRVPEHLLKNSSAVRSAFSDAVAAARYATVEVVCKGRMVSLGTVVSPDGFILTKASELQPEPECRLGDGRRLSAMLIGLADEYDLALLKINVREIMSLEFPSQEPPVVGTLLATPGLSDKPVSIGILSAAPRKIRHPSGVLGISVEESDDGPKINKVFPESGADAAGIRVNDIVRQINGIEIKNRRALVQHLSGKRPGDEVQLRILRDKEDLEMAATLGAPPRDPKTDRRSFQNSLGGELSERREGFPLAFEHDTVLSPQQCGGPLVDLDGHLVGINIARAGRTASFALPAHLIGPLVDDLLAGKYAVQADPETSETTAPSELEEPVAKPVGTAAGTSSSSD